jgi:MFS family permease
MGIPIGRGFGQRYAFVVVGAIFFALLTAAALRSAPGVLLSPLEAEFGWPPAVVSASAAVGIFVNGLVGPFAGGLMARVGLRRTVIGALLLMSTAIGLSLLMTQPWQLTLTWGILASLGAGTVAPVLGATIVNRWFVRDRGLMMGLMSASTATGTLVFLPALAALAQSGGWRAPVVALAVAMALLVPLVALLVPESPATIGIGRYGATHDDSREMRDGATRPGFFAETLGTLMLAARTRTFWLLFATFFVCGFTTDGIVGTHLVAYCGDHAVPEVAAASLLALMGACDLVGTTISGWLTDRFDPRKLLVVYYGLRACRCSFCLIQGSRAGPCRCSPWSTGLTGWRRSPRPSSSAMRDSATGQAPSCSHGHWPATRPEARWRPSWGAGCVNCRANMPPLSSSPASPASSLPPCP